MNRNTRVVGNFRPSLLNEVSIRMGLLSWVMGQGFTPLVNTVIRDPLRNQWDFGDKTNEALAFHRDIVSGNMPDAVFMWSNELPTEIMFADGTMLQISDGDIVQVDNDEVLHRTPPVWPANRWFARVIANRTVVK